MIHSQAVWRAPALPDFQPSARHATGNPVCKLLLAVFLPVFLSTLFANFLSAQSPAQSTTGERPNIVIILADDMGYSDAGCYGGEIKTPRLDALANDGVRFTQFYNTARCWPTRSALMTGHYAQAINRDALPKKKGGGQGIRPSWAPLITESLSKVGYKSYHSGKWHIDGEPTENGFKHSYQVEDHNRLFYPQKTILDGKVQPKVDRDSGYYSTTAIANHAIECLTEHQSQSPDAPFFSFVAFLSPHFPLHAPADDIAKYSGTYDIGWDVARQNRMMRMESLLGLPAKLSPLEPQIGPPYSFPDDIKQLGDGEIIRECDWTSLTPAQKEFQATKMEIHAAMIDRMDQEIGRIIDHLKSFGKLDNTLVLFLSDNGASAEIMIRGDGHDPKAAAGSADTFLCLGPGWSSCANSPFRRHKTWVHEGGIATPMIAHWPNRIQQTGLRTQAAHVIDVVPTILEIAQIEHDSDKTAPAKPGRSLLDAMIADQPMQRESLWWLHEGHRAFRQGDWKIVSAKGEPWELYDLSTDRSEMNDLATSQPERVQRMSDAWQQQTESLTRMTVSK